MLYYKKSLIFSIFILASLLAVSFLYSETRSRDTDYLGLSGPVKELTEKQSGQESEAFLKAGSDSVGEMDVYQKYTYSERRGKRMFGIYCVICHGDSGQGDGFNAFNLDPRPHDLTDTEYMSALTDASLNEVTAQGGRGVNKSILMPAYDHTLSEREIREIVSYIRTLPGPADEEVEITTSDN